MSSVDLSEAQIAALASLQEVLREERWSLIGATALRCYVDMPRPTNDVDLAVIAAGDAVNERLRAGGWSRHPQKTQTWLKGVVSVDVVAASEEQVAAGVVELEPGLALTVVGFDLAVTAINRFDIRSLVGIPVPRLPVLALLKMIAWLDRPYERVKDLDDLGVVLDRALQDLDDRRWEQPLADVDHDLQSAFWLGYELGLLMELSHLHWAQRFLERLRSDESTEFAMLRNASRLVGEDVDAMIRARLTALEQGLAAARRAMPVAATPPPIPVAARPPRATSPFRPRLPRVAAPMAPSLFAWGQSGSLQMLLHTAIDNKQVVRFQYKGLDRIVEPHVLGTKDGRLQVLTWQIGGESSRGTLPDWRRFFVDEISGGDLTGATFAGAKVTLGRKHSAFDRQIAVVR